MLCNMQENLRIDFSTHKTKKETSLSCRLFKTRRRLTLDQLKYLCPYYLHSPKIIAFLLSWHILSASMWNDEAEMLPTTQAFFGFLV